MIGEALKISYGIIQSINHNPHYSDVDKLSEVLQTWIDTQSSNVTWRNLIDVITEYPVNEPALAKTIPDFLANPKISSKYDIGPSNNTTDSSYLNIQVANVLLGKSCMVQFQSITCTVIYYNASYCLSMVLTVMF